jgi:nicotinamide-nucleotide amidase
VFLGRHCTQNTKASGVVYALPMQRISDRQLAVLARRVGRHLKSRLRVVSTAESCTGGWVGKALTDIDGSSEWFVEGFVTYRNAAKIDTLGVAPSVLRQHGAVSEAAARGMAKGALRRAKADVSVAVTGIAGPGGAVPGKPVGTVWFAWAIRHGRSARLTTRLEHFRGDREAVRRQAVRVALRGLLEP